MKHRLLAPLVITAVAACHVSLLGDMEVSWTINGSRSTSLCATHRIQEWHIEARGPEVITTTVSCMGSWQTGTIFYGIEEGLYDVTVRAIQIGTGKELASRTVSGMRVWSGDPPRLASVAFSDADFTGGGAYNFTVYWNIQGTVDGTRTGTSWDTCAEVGASYAEIEIGGTSHRKDCHAAGNMAAGFNVASKPGQVRVRLLDSAQQGITTWTGLAPGEDVSGKPNHWDYVADFYWDSFLTIKNTTKGDYLFKVSFEGKSCSQTTPQGKNQVTLLKLNGQPVSPTPQVCAPSCVLADGVTPLGCVDKDQQQKMPSVLWGEYQLKLQGTVQSLDICWEKTSDIVIGAGTVNPVVPHDVTRISTSGACQ